MQESKVPFLEVPVFRPKEQDFSNFSSLISKIERDPRAIKAGLAKIISPVTIKPNLVHGNFVLNKCVVQNVERFEKGMFMLNFDQEYSLTLSKFKDYIAKNHVPIDGNVEDLFWRDILKRNTKAPVYSIDNDKSLYPDSWPYWRINSLSQEQSIIHQDGIELKGMNTSYLNFGMQFTSFGMHHEDSNLGSMNILQGGEVKTWYGVASKYAPKLEQFVNQFTPKNIDCDYIIRHKGVLVPPSVLEFNKIPFSKVEQNVGDIIVTLYNSYHQGFNNGFNWAESSNYATPKWMIYYNMTTLCNCPYGKEAQSRHDLLGEVIENWKESTSNSRSAATDMETNAGTRFDNFDHWVEFDGKKSRSRCKMPGCVGFTHIFCSKCRVYLCCNLARNCFRVYHTS